MGKSETEVGHYFRGKESSNQGGENSKLYDCDCKVFLLSSPAQIPWSSAKSRTKNL